MTAVGVCPDHGYHDGERCPECGSSGRRVLDGDRRVSLSKFLSGALRHFPDDVGLDLDRAGWVAFDALVAAVTDRYGWADREGVEAVVATDPKGRFERDGGRVRAAYGHSVPVDLDADPPGGDGTSGDDGRVDASGSDPVPDVLYHGTSPGALDDIRREGLRPMGRQAVHLSGTVADAREVGRRHAADPVVLAVDAAALQADGHPVRRRGPRTYTTDRVPPGYLSVHEGR